MWGVINLSCTVQSVNVFLSLVVKTLWKNKLWLISTKSNGSWSWSNCLWKKREPHLAVVSQLLWSLLSSRIQLSSLQHNSPLKKNFTGAQHLHTVCGWAAVNRCSYRPHRGFYNSVLKTKFIAKNTLPLSTGMFALYSELISARTAHKTHKKYLSGPGSCW